MTNAIGMFLKQLQKENNETQNQMIEKLGVNRSFYFKVCNGGKKCPDKWYELIPSVYRLDSEKRKEWIGAIIASNHRIDFIYGSLNDDDKKLVFTLANLVDTMHPKHKEKIWDSIKMEVMKMNEEEQKLQELYAAPTDFSDNEKKIWTEILEGVKSIGYKMRYSIRLEMYEYVKLRIMRDKAMKAWNENPERYVKIVTGIAPDMKTPKITIKENEHYAIMLDCNKQIQKILDELKLTPKAMARY
ncbi:MAG: P27 family phage terminase small subunit [Clostridiales bacterium]|jgi:transcriptional regulator with XRE-family HTH domain|nr:P27 family phage terminase small subunit [Clostridiales bacterium]